MQGLGGWIGTGAVGCLLIYLLFQATKSEDYDCAFGEKGSEKRVEACRLLTFSNNSASRCEGYARLLGAGKANRTEALVACDLAIKEHPGSPMAHNMRANAYSAAGDQKTAIDEFSEAYRLYPEPVFLENRAQTWENMGEPDKAKADYAEAQKLRSKK